MKERRQQTALTRTVQSKADRAGQQCVAVVKYRTVRYGTVKYNTAQCSTVQYSTYSVTARNAEVKRQKKRSGRTYGTNMRFVCVVFCV
jgi:hypothetical protein